MKLDRCAHLKSDALFIDSRWFSRIVTHISTARYTLSSL